AWGAALTWRDPSLGTTGQQIAPMDHSPTARVFNGPKSRPWQASSGAVGGCPRRCFARCRSTTQFRSVGQSGTVPTHTSTASELAVGACYPAEYVSFERLIQLLPHRGAGLTSNKATHGQEVGSRYLMTSL